MSKTDERVKRSADEGRENRAMTDRVITENREAHHDAPNREEGKLRDTADFLAQQAEGSGSKIVQGDGNKELGESRLGQFDLG